MLRDYIFDIILRYDVMILSLYVTGTEIPPITSNTLYEKSHLTKSLNYACGINHISWNDWTGAYLQDANQRNIVARVEITYNLKVVDHAWRSQRLKYMFWIWYR